MSEARYTLILEGFPGIAPGEAHDALARTFGLQPDAAAELLARAPIAIKRGLPVEQVQAYVDALLAVGAEVTTRCDDTGVATRHGPSQPATTPDGPLTYSIELVGHPGSTASAAAAGLAEAFGIAAGSAAELVARAPVTVKRGVDDEQLVTYIDALCGAGFAVMTLCEQNGEASHYPAQPAGEPVDAPGRAGAPEPEPSASPEPAPSRGESSADLPDAYVVEDRSEVGAASEQARWKAMAVRYAPAVCGLAAVLIAGMLIWDCLSADRKPVTGQYRSSHLGMYLFFPEGWYERSDRHFSKREQNGVKLRGSNFYRGDSDDPELSLIVARMSDLPRGEGMRVLDFGQLAANMDGYILGGYHLRGVYCESWHELEHVAKCAGYATARGRERAMLMYVFIDNGDLFVFMFIHKSDYEVIAGEAMGIFGAARTALKVGN